MDFGQNGQDDELIRMLGQLKDAGPEYPSSMFSRRRMAVLAAFAALNLGVATAGISLLAGIAKMLKGMGLVEKIILGVEVAAVTGLTAYGAVTAYVYRDELKQLLFPTSQNITTPFPSLSIPSPLSPTQIAESETPSPSPTPTGTLLFTGTPPVVQSGGGGGPAPTAASGGGAPTNCGQQGHCYGKSTRTPNPKPGGGGGG